jgi:hypothetical protein
MNCWNTAEEKLLCFMTLDDEVAQKLNVNADSAYWRAFIVQDRKTGEISAKFRYKYRDGNVSWYVVGPRQEQENAVERLVEGLKQVHEIACQLFGLQVSDVVGCFYPPDDGGDPFVAIRWLEAQDLIEVTEVKLPKEGDNLIVKVQWPLAGDPESPFWKVLIYNEDHSVFEWRPCSEEWKKAMQGRPKVYYHAHLGPDKILHIDEKAEDQPW